MPINVDTQTLDALKAFIEDDPYYAGLWRGLHIIVMEYLSENLNEGLHTEINALFFKDFISLMDLIWALNTIEAEREQK